MVPTERMKSLRRSTPGCRSLVYVDLKARLVLCSDSDLPVPPQEALDALCLRGARLLTGSLRAAADAALAEPVAEAVAVQGGRIEVYLSTPAAPDEALCGVLEASADPHVALDILRRGIDTILPEDAARSPANLQKGS